MQIPNAHTRLTPSLEIPPSIRGRGRRKGGSSTSQPHPQRVLNLSKKSQLKSMGEREERRKSTYSFSNQSLGLNLSLQWNTNPLERDRRRRELFLFLGFFKRAIMGNGLRRKKGSGETRLYPQPASHPTVAAAQSLTKNSSSGRK